jgi:hypothetical protein
MPTAFQRIQFCFHGELLSFQNALLLPHLLRFRERYFPRAGLMHFFQMVE